MVDDSSRPFTMPAPGSPADRLAELTLDHLLAEGDPSDSLRSIADAIGTSHRMLQYHFVTKERLLGVVLLKYRRRKPDEPPREFESRSDYVRHSWRVYRRPENLLMMQLLILITSPGSGAVGDESLMTGLGDRWSETLVALGLREGLTLERSEAEARLVRDAWRGLHLDLYGTGDTDAVEAALDVLLHWLDASPSVQPGGR